MIKSVKDIKNQSGFTILEMLVVIAIVSMGMLGVISLVIQSMQIEYINKNVLIASQLAQEGLEIVRNNRDNNWLNGASWSNGFEGAYFAVDYTGAMTIVMRGSDAAILKIDPTTGMYQHTTGSKSPFSRVVTFTNLGTSSTTVSCLVQWTEKDQIHDYRAETVLYDWK